MATGKSPSVTAAVTKRLTEEARQRQAPVEKATVTEELVLIPASPDSVMAAVMANDASASESTPFEQQLKFYGIHRSHYVKLNLTERIPIPDDLDGGTPAEAEYLREYLTSQLAALTRDTLNLPADPWQALTKNVRYVGEFTRGPRFEIKRDLSPALLELFEDSLFLYGQATPLPGKEVAGQKKIKAGAPKPQEIDFPSEESAKQFIKFARQWAQYRDGGACSVRAYRIKNADKVETNTVRFHALPKIVKPHRGTASVTIMGPIDTAPLVLVPPAVDPTPVPPAVDPTPVMPADE